MNNEANQEQSQTKSPSPKPESNTAVDPVCGMDVTTTSSTERLEKAGHVYFFCSAECREQFEASPDDFDG
jgi:YHS domain-containing protein